MKSFSIESGEKIFLKGLNGSGKSTLIRTICGLLPLKSGAILIEDELISPKTISRVVQDKFSVLLTSILMANEMLIEDYFDLHRDSLNQEDLSKLIQLFSLESVLEKNFNAISDGEKQKVLLTKSLAKKAVLYILDEPVTYLDYLSRELFYNYILNEDNKTFLISSHDLLEMERISSRTIEI